MGFGLLFSGYSILLLFRTIPIEIIGFYIMYLALDKLGKHDRHFAAAKYACIYLFFEAIFGIAIWLGAFVEPSGFLASETARLVESVLYQTGLCVFHILLLRAIMSISSAVGYTKGRNRSRFGIAAVSVFYAAEIVAALVPGMAVYLVNSLAIYQLFLVLFNMFNLYGCYMMIVTDEMLEKEEEKYTKYLEKHGGNKKPQLDGASSAVKNSGKKYRAQSKKK